MAAITPGHVHDSLRRHMLVDGFDLVLDTRASSGSWIVDARDGSRHLDLFSFFASAPLGMNHPALTGDPEFMAELAHVAVNKPSNSDVYTTQMAEFVDTFSRVLGGGVCFDRPAARRCAERGDRRGGVSRCSCECGEAHRRSVAPDDAG